MTIPHIPTFNQDEKTHRKRISETVNQILKQANENMFRAGDIRFYGAKSGSGDCTPAFYAALADAGEAYVPAGDWRLDTGISLTQNQHVTLEAGAIITRYSAYSALTTPMFWIKGSQGAIIGTGIASVIQTQNKAPDGVVLIGATSMTVDITEDVLYCTIARLKIKGMVAYGQTSGSPDACLKIIAPQLVGFANYFHFINDMVYNSSNYGLWLQGWANGLLVSNQHGYWLGNVTRGTGAGRDAMIYSQGALDNSLSGLFHHFSPDTPTILVEDLDNTGTGGGSLHVTAYSAFTNVVCEQGGSNAYALIANASCTAFKNYFQIVDNVALAYDVSAARLAGNNFLFSSTGFSVEDIQIRDTLVVTGVTTLNGQTAYKQSGSVDTAVTYSASMSIDASLGDIFTITATNGTAFTINNPTNPQVGQTIRIRIRNTSGGALGVLTWGANYRAINATQPGNAAYRSRDFQYYNATVTWVEVSGTNADVAN